MSKIIIITGASSGMGFVTAKLLAEQGHKVYGLARRLERMEPLKEYGVIPKRVDLYDLETTEKVIQEIIAAEGRVDVLINNAGYSETGAMIDVKKDKAEKQLHLNVIVPSELFKMVFPTMKQQNEGLIINLSSMGGKITFPLMGWYHASKYALEALSNAMRLESKKFGIKVVLVEPGGIKTEFGQVASTSLVENNHPDSIYKENYEAINNPKMNERMDKNLTDPLVIAKLISKIIDKKKPKARYAKGYLAKPLIFLGKYFPNMFDRIMRRFYNLD